MTPTPSHVNPNPDSCDIYLKKNKFDVKYIEYKNKLNDVHRKFINGSDYHVKCQSKILSWGYWNNHPIAKDHPEVITKMTIKEAIQDIVDLL